MTKILLTGIWDKSKRSEYEYSFVLDLINEHGSYNIRIPAFLWEYFIHMPCLTRLQQQQLNPFIFSILCHPKSMYSQHWTCTWISSTYSSISFKLWELQIQITKHKVIQDKTSYHNKGMKVRWNVRLLFQALITAASKPDGRQNFSNINSNYPARWPNIYFQYVKNLF